MASRTALSCCHRGQRGCVVMWGAVAIYAFGTWGRAISTGVFATAAQAARRIRAGGVTVSKSAATTTLEGTTASRPHHAGVVEESNFGRGVLPANLTTTSRPLRVQEMTGAGQSRLSSTVSASRLGSTPCRTPAQFDVAGLRSILQRLEKSADELAKANEALHAQMTDDEVLADMDSVLEYEYRAEGSVGLLRHHIEELAVRTSRPSRSNAGLTNRNSRGPPYSSGSLPVHVCGIIATKGRLCPTPSIS
ncbi:hypothetical protein MTO96_011464 [Rhipicephalus appendiculatus]